MPRAMKCGKFINCKVDINIANKLDEYSQKTHIPKTAIVEMALSEYFKKADKRDNATKKISK